MKMPHKQTQLYIFLGAGGVGKTTLAASTALALANSGKKVGLLSIDPAKRLQSALGINLEEREVYLPLENSQGKLCVAMLEVENTLKRWISQSNITISQQEKLFSNPYYIALSGRLATSHDILAAIYIAEWIERYPDFDIIIVDTAPGLHSIDFISKPEKLSLLLDSNLLSWLKILIEKKNKFSILNNIFNLGAKKILDGLAMVGGGKFLINFAEFLILIENMLNTAIKRLEYFHQLILQHSSIILINAVRHDAIAVCKHFICELSQLNLVPTLAIINKALPEALLEQDSLQNILRLDEINHLDAKALSNYFINYQQLQNKLKIYLQNNAKIVIEVPNSANLDTSANIRLVDLSSLGKIITAKI